MAQQKASVTSPLESCRFNFQHSQPILLLKLLVRTKKTEMCKLPPKEDLIYGSTRSSTEAPYYYFVIYAV